MDKTISELQSRVASLESHNGTGIDSLKIRLAVIENQLDTLLKSNQYWYDRLVKFIIAVALLYISFRLSG